MGRMGRGLESFIWKLNKGVIKVGTVERLLESGWRVKAAMKSLEKNMARDCKIEKADSA